jgi:release factor glutamine methyltransferase
MAVIAPQRIPFGPALIAPADWLEGGGRLEAGRRHELLVAIRADKPYQI